MNARFGIALLAIAGVVVCAWLLASGSDAGDAEVVGAQAAPRAEPAADLSAIDPDRAHPAAERATVAADPPASIPASAPASAPARVYGPDVILHVKDLANRAELIDVELRSLAQYFWSASWTRPPADTAREAIVVAKGAVSPITLRTWRLDGDENDVIRGLVAVDAQGIERADITLESDWRAHRGVTFWAQAPAFAWERIDVDVTVACVREVLLSAGGALRVRVENAQLERYRLLGRNAWLHVTHESGPDSASQSPMTQVSASQPLTEELVAHGGRVDALQPGDYRVSVVLGEWWEADKRSELGVANVTLAAGEERDVTIRLSDPPAPAREAFLGGALTFPPFPKESDVVVRFYNVATYSQGRADLEIALDAMTRTSPNGRTWEFRAPAMKVGRYQLRVWPFLFSTLVDLPAEGNPGVNIVVNALADVTARVRDARTGLPVAIPDLYWGPQWVDAGYVNHTIDRIPSESEPGIFHFTAMPGPIELVMYEAPEGTSYGYTNRNYDVVAGKNELTFELASVTGLKFVLKENGTVLPIGPLYTGLEGGISGPGRPTMIRIALDGVVELSEPGEYEVAFPDFVPPRYRAVPSRRVTVKSGAITDVIVDLERP